MDHRDFAISNDQFLTLIIRQRLNRNRCASDPVNLVCLEHSEDSAYCKFTAENFNWVVADYKFKWRYGDRRPFFSTERAGPYPQAQLYWAGRTMGWMAD